MSKLMQIIIYSDLRKLNTPEGRRSYLKRSIIEKYEEKEENRGRDIVDKKYLRNLQVDTLDIKTI